MVTDCNGKKYPFEECAAYFYFLIKRNHYQAYLINEIYTNIYTILYNKYDVGQLFVNILIFLVLFSDMPIYGYTVSSSLRADSLGEV